ncbi:MAG: DNA-binding protein HU-beta [Flavobacteriales bacterium]|jgi:DNA-binding protein HU-beta
MRKAELVDSVAKATDLNQLDADNAVSAMFEHITNALARGEDVSLIGFGSFTVKQRAARAGRNPANGETIQIAASKNAHFKAGKRLKDSLKT